MLSESDIVYNSYSGTDIVAQVILPNEAPLVLAELQTISYSIHRENSPVRFLGRVNPAGFIRGPRTIAGSMIFTVFNQYAFYRLKQFQLDVLDGLYPLADMLPVFDVAISMVNEYGSMSQMRIYGITIIDEGQTMSVDDLIIEQTYTYIAQGIIPLTATSGNLPNNVAKLTDVIDVGSDTYAVPIQPFPSNQG